MTLALPHPFPECFPHLGALPTLRVLLPPLTCTSFDPQPAALLEAPAAHWCVCLVPCACVCVCVRVCDGAPLRPPTSSFPLLCTHFPPLLQRACLVQLRRDPGNWLRVEASAAGRVGGGWVGASMWNREQVARQEGWAPLSCAALRPLDSQWRACTVTSSTRAARSSVTRIDAMLHGNTHTHKPAHTHTHGEAGILSGGHVWARECVHVPMATATAVVVNSPLLSFLVLPFTKVAATRFCTVVQLPPFRVSRRRGCKGGLGVCVCV